jgi:hypothetical protein
LASFNRTAVRVVLLRDVLAPFATYKVLAAYGVSDSPALAIAALIPAGGLLHAWATHHGVSVFGGLSTTILMLGIAATSVTGDARILLARASLVTGLVGIACLISAARLAGIRPLAFYVIRQFGGGERARTGTLESAWDQRRGFRTGIAVLTAFWGMTCLVEATLRVVLAYRLPVEVMAAMSPTLTVAFAVIIVGSTLVFARLMRRGSSTWGSGPG